MSAGRKFYSKRTYEQGEMGVDVGFRSGDLVVRLMLPSGPVSITYDQADDLADLLDDALDSLDRDPLDWGDHQ